MRRLAIFTCTVFLACACGSDEPAETEPGETLVPAPSGAPPVDECAQGSHTCSPNGICTDRRDGYTCKCATGWEGDGLTCIPTPPVVAIEAAPPPFTNADSATFAFSCNDGEICTFECRLQPAEFVACTSPWTSEALTEGQKIFEVRGTNSRGGVASAQAEFVVDRTPPALTAASFVSYDELDLTFSEPIDAQSLSAASFHLTPGPSNIQVISATASSEAVVRLLVSAYHLPMDYTLSLATDAVRDRAGNASTAIAQVLPGSSSGSRVMFATTTQTSGNISLPVGVTCGATTGLGRADCICQHEATSAGLHGTFRALLSDSYNDLYCRIRGLDGKPGVENESTSCGVARSELPIVGPWVRMDGFPVVRTELTGSAPLLFISSVRYSVSEKPAIAQAWMSTDWLSDNCDNWTKSDSTSSARLVSVTDVLFRNSGLARCGYGLGLVCAQVNSGGFPLGSRHKHKGKRVFITSQTHTGALASADEPSGLAAADAHCGSEAGAAGLESANGFVAWLSDDSQDAYCRLAGAQGKKAANCGLPALPNVVGPYVSTSGMLLADDLAELTDPDRGLREPFVGDATGAPVSISITWTGTNKDGTAAVKHCESWTAGFTPAEGQFGMPASAETWTGPDSVTCGQMRRLTCFEL